MPTDITLPIPPRPKRFLTGFAVLVGSRDEFAVAEQTLFSAGCRYAGEDCPRTVAPYIDGCPIAVGVTATGILGLYFDGSEDAGYLNEQAIAKIPFAQLGVFLDGIPAKTRAA